MPNFSVISRSAHGNLRWRRPSSLSFAANEFSVPIVAAEIGKAMATMPLAFVQQGGHLALVALLSTVPGKNFFVGPNGNWLHGYMPAAFRSFPFRMLQTEGREEAVLCIDEDSGLVSGTNEGELFFGPDGSPTQAVQEIINFQVELEKNRIATDVAINSLRQANVIVPWPLLVQTEDGDKTMNGLYRIDETALNSLSNEAFGGLRAMGALTVAFGQLFSMNQLSVFQTLAHLHAQYAPKQFAPLPDTLDKLFDRNDNSLLRFD